MAILSYVAGIVFVKNVLLYHLPLLVYAVVILSVSSVPNLKPPEVGLPNVDKLAHFAEYAVLAFLTFRSFSRLGSDRSPGMTALWTLMFLVVFAYSGQNFAQMIHHHSLLPLKFSSSIE